MGITKSTVIETKMAFLTSKENEKIKKKKEKLNLYKEPISKQGTLINFHPQMLERKRNH